LVYFREAFCEVEQEEEEVVCGNLLLLLLLILLFFFFPPLGVISEQEGYALVLHRETERQRDDAKQKNWS
jgi:hypothetical protein